MFNVPYNYGLTPQQRLAQLEAMYPQYAQQQAPAQQVPQVQAQAQAQMQQQVASSQGNSIINVASLQEAQNAQIPMNGTVSYFAFGDSILARNWSFATGKIENILYKKVMAEETAQEITPEKIDRLKIIEEKLDTLITQSKYPINKNKGVNKDAE